MQNDRKNSVTADTDTIDIPVFLSDLKYGVRKFRWVIVALVLLAGGIAFWCSVICHEPVYTCTAVYAVHLEQADGIDTDGMPIYAYTYQDTLAGPLGNAFAYAVDSPLVRRQISEALGLTMAPEEMDISAAFVNESNLLTLTVSAEDPDRALEIMECFLSQYASVTDIIIGRTSLIPVREPVRPTEASNAQNGIAAVLIGILIGLAAGGAWVVFCALIRDTVRTKEDIRKKLNAVCLGVLPKKTEMLSGGSAATAHTDLCSESVGLLWCTVRSALGCTHGVITVTGTAPGEGTTALTYSLAADAAAGGARVAVIDCDWLCTGAEPASLTPVYRDETHMYALFRTEIPGWDIVRLEIPGNPAFGFCNEAVLRGAAEALSGDYDWILIDTPPCGITADAEAAAHVSDGVIYVVRQNTVMLECVRTGLKRIRRTGARLLGCVLNGAEQTDIQSRKGG
ncbi:MAG: hypothetical protein E7604_03565 [Ruminococcaceae bacterium]|nr:hypothetical protein [Oscillospiraceae bacterium]